MSLKDDAAGWIRNGPVRAVVVASVAAIVIGAALGFAGGFKVEQSRTSSNVNRLQKQVEAALGIALPQRIGEVTAVGRDSLTVTTRQGRSLTIKADATTAIDKAAKGATSDIVAGRHVIINDSPREVLVLEPGSTLGRAVGVTDIPGGFFTITAGNGRPANKVKASRATVVYTVTKATLSDIKKGDEVLADGHVTSNGTLDAIGIIALPAGTGFAK